MELITGLYVSQPFWIWMALAVALLAAEAAFSTEWLLWPAVSAGVVAVLAMFGLRLGIAGELAVFGLLTVTATVFSRRLIKRVNPEDHPDINDRGLSLIGSRGQVIEALPDGRGRVFVSGAEWLADFDGAAQVGDSVVVAAVDGSRLTVRPAS